MKNGQSLLFVARKGWFIAQVRSRNILWTSIHEGNNEIPNVYGPLRACESIMWIAEEPNKNVFVNRGTCS